jgi:hypothetical protein
MYRDPSNIRKHTAKVRFNDREHDLVQAWVNYTGGELAPLIRKWVLEQAQLDLGLNETESEGTKLSLLRAS